MQAGLIQPGPKTLQKLAAFKQRYQYNQLRASGAPIKTAKKLSRGDFTTAMKQAMLYEKKAKQVAAALSKTQKRKIDPRFILYHMYHSDRDLEDWDKYETALVG